MNSFGTRLKELRTEKEILQRELADHLNVSRVTITQYESGARSPDDEIKKKIAKYFNVSLDFLMGNSDIRNPYEEKEELPEDFETAEEAIDFLLNKNVIMGAGGFDVNDLSDEDKVRFAHELLEHLKLLSLKYKK